jgi:predicted DNA binding CopG/RHH family protein
VVSGSSLPLKTEDHAGEERHTELGESAKGQLLLVVWTWRCQKIRVVTAFPAKRTWRTLWNRLKKESMMPRKNLVSARTETEEARWFEENQDQLLKLFEEAEKEGTIRIGDKNIGITVSKSTGGIVKPRSKKVMLRIPTDDLDRARLLAQRKGLPYQTYMKMLLREGLDQEGKVKLRA